MSNKSAKRIAEQNARMLRMHLLGVLLVNLWYAVAVQLLWPTQVWTTAALLCLALLASLQWVPLWALFSAGRPRYDHAGALVAPAVDLSNAGPLEYAKDLLYIASFVMAGLPISGYFWLGLLLIPAFVIAMLVGHIRNAMLGGMSAGAAATPTPTGKTGTGDAAADGAAAAADRRKQRPRIRFVRH